MQDKYQALFSCPILARAFSNPIKRLDERVVQEFSTNRVIAVNCDLSEEASPAILSELVTLHDEFGWQIIFHESLRDNATIYGLCFDEFLSGFDRKTFALNVHLEIRDTSYDFCAYDELTAEHTIDCTLDDMTHAQLALKSLINHGCYFSPDSPENRPVTRQMLRFPS